MDQSYGSRRCNWAIGTMLPRQIHQRQHSIQVLHRVINWFWSRRGIIQCPWLKEMVRVYWTDKWATSLPLCETQTRLSWSKIDSSSCKHLWMSIESWSVGVDFKSEFDTLQRSDSALVDLVIQCLSCHPIVFWTILGCANHSKVLLDKENGAVRLWVVDVIFLLAFWLLPVAIACSWNMMCDVPGILLMSFAPLHWQKDFRKISFRAVLPPMFSTNEWTGSFCNFLSISPSSRHDRVPFSYSFLKSECRHSTTCSK